MSISMRFIYALNACSLYLAYSPGVVSAYSHSLGHEHHVLNIGSQLSSLKGMTTHSLFSPITSQEQTSHIMKFNVGYLFLTVFVVVLLSLMSTGGIILLVSLNFESSITNESFKQLDSMDKCLTNGVQCPGYNQKSEETGKVPSSKYPESAWGM